MAMTRAQFARRLQEGLNAIFGMEYKRWPQEWRMLFEVVRSNKAYEEQILTEGLGAAQIKAEGAGVAYDTGRDVWSVRFTHRTYALAFALTEEARDDNLYGELGQQYGQALARSMLHTKELEGASVFNNGFDAGGSYNGGDGVPLFSTSHPLSGGGTFANKLATPADLAEESLEDLCILAEGFTDERGIPLACMITRLAIPRQLRFTARKLLESEYTPFSADNAKNVVRDMFNQQPAVNHRFTDTDAYFGLTDCPKGLQHFVRRPLRRGTEGDFESGNMRFKASERYVFGWGNPRGAVASEGAA